MCGVATTTETSSSHCEPVDKILRFPSSLSCQTGLYTNGIFKFVLKLPPEYNGIDAHPQIVFSSYVFNPHVNAETGELDIRTTYPRWDRK
jgi:ubiquitin-protein ligase